MDIKRLIDQNEIDDFMKLRQHFYLMLANSVMYNESDTEYFKMAKEMFEDSTQALSVCLALSSILGPEFF